MKDFFLKHNIIHTFLSASKSRFTTSSLDKLMGLFFFISVKEGLNLNCCSWRISTLLTEKRWREEGQSMSSQMATEGGELFTGLRWWMIRLTLVRSRRTSAEMSLLCHNCNDTPTLSPAARNGSEEQVLGFRGWHQIHFVKHFHTNWFLNHSEVKVKQQKDHLLSGTPEETGWLSHCSPGSGTGSCGPLWWRTGNHN